MGKCVTCGIRVDEEKAPASTVYQGKTFYFCCVTCKERFEISPTLFVERQTGNEREGS